MSDLGYSTTVDAHIPLQGQKDLQYWLRWLANLWYAKSVVCCY